MANDGAHESELDTVFVVRMIIEFHSSIILRNFFI